MIYMRVHASFTPKAIINQQFYRVLRDWITEFFFDVLMLIYHFLQLTHHHTIEHPIAK